MDSRPIRIYIDYPISADKTFRGLSFPQVLHDYLKTQPSVQLVNEYDQIDILFVISGGSHYAPRNNYWNPSFWFDLFLQKVCGDTSVLTHAAKTFSRENVYYKDRIKRLIARNPSMKIVHRLDSRYRQLCKIYSYDETVRWINKLAHTTIFQTEYCKSTYTAPGGLQTIFGLETAYTINNGITIANPVDTNVFRPDGDSIELDGEIKIFHVATTGMTRKGLGTVLEFAKLLKENPKIQFYLVGRQNEDPVFGVEIKNHPNIHHIPHTNDRFELARYYRSGDILLYPTVNDCSPNVVLEAMACGMPVVAVKSGGTPELIIKDDVVGGLLINPSNPVHALQECIDNLEHLQQKCVILVQRYHTQEHIGAQYLNVFKNMTQ